MAWDYVGKASVTCWVCKGEKVIRIQTDPLNENIYTEVPCPKCDGNGEVDIFDIKLKAKD